MLYVSAATILGAEPGDPGDSDDKVIIRHDRGLHWTYFSVRNNRRRDVATVALDEAAASSSSRPPSTRAIHTAEWILLRKDGTAVPVEASTNILPR